MKKRIVSLLCALALVVSLAGCAISSTPASVGTIGETEISSGMYLLSQYQAYYAALEAAQKQEVKDGETMPDYQAMDTKDFLAETITVEEEETKVSDFVAKQTLENLQYFAAVDAMFAEMNGELTAEQQDAISMNAKSIWDGSADLYEKNGFGLATIEAYQTTLYKADQLLRMIYDKDGTEEVSDSALKAHLGQDAWFLHTATVPLFNPNNFQMLDENTTKIKAQCEAALEIYEEGRADSEDVYKLFRDTMYDRLPAAYLVTESTFTPEQAMATNLLDENALEAYFSEESAKKLRALKPGDTLLLDDSGFAIEMYQMVDPDETGEWDELRGNLLGTIYGPKLQERLVEKGASLEVKLDDAAMQKLPASKILVAVG